MLSPGNDSWNKQKWYFTCANHVLIFERLINGRNFVSAIDGLIFDGGLASTFYVKICLVTKGF